MGLSSKFNDPKYVPRLPGLHFEIALLSDGRGQILVQAHPSTRNGRISSHIPLGLLIKSLHIWKCVSRRRKNPVHLLGLDAESWILGTKSGRDLLLLNTGRPLLVLHIG